MIQIQNHQNLFTHLIKKNGLNLKFILISQNFLCDTMKNITKEEASKKFKIEESIIKILSIPKANDFLIATELRIIRTNGANKIMWESGFHTEVIIDMILLKDKLQIKEFDESIYCLDLNSGKTII